MATQMKESSEIRVESRFIFLQSVSEIGLGSALHALRLPFTGHFLSLNQTLILCRATRKLNDFGSRVLVSKSLARISVVCALLKTLSPAGKVLTPMLAITAQGLLFASVILLAGTGSIALVLASAFLSLWAILQPLLIAWVLFGKNFFLSFLWSWEKLTSPLGLSPDDGLLFFAALVLLKVGLAVMVALLADGPRLGYLNEVISQRGRELYTRQRKEESRSITSPIEGALRDLLSPFFLFSLLLTSLFFVMSQEAGARDLVIYILRPLTLGFLLFYFVRSFPGSRVSRFFLERSPRLAELFRTVRDELKAPK